jgi:glutamate synthase (NADPH/NADH) large chain
VTLDKVLTAAEQAEAGIPMHKDQADETLLKKLIEDHHRWTGSLRAREILDNWSAQPCRSSSRSSRPSTAAP